MANNYINDQISTATNIKNTPYLGKLHDNEPPTLEYTGRQPKGSGGDIGLAKANNSKDIGLSGKNSGGVNLSGKNGDYQPNNAS